MSKLIDWDKPIETTTNHPANYIGRESAGSWPYVISISGKLVHCSIDGAFNCFPYYIRNVPELVKPEKVIVDPPYGGVYINIDGDCIQVHANNYTSEYWKAMVKAAEPFIEYLEAVEKQG